MSALEQLEHILDHFEPPVKRQRTCDGTEPQEHKQEFPKEEKFEFDVNSFECMPCEKNLLYDFQKWMNLESITSQKQKQTRKEIHLKLLNAHPFVKKTGALTTYDYPKHRFTIQRYQLDCRAFSKWARKNKAWKVKAGGNTVTDDGLYTVSLILRKVLPRGFHSIYVTHKSETDTNETKADSNNSNSDKLLFFRGIPKFTGLVASDEDEQSKSSENSASFFYRNYSISDCVSFVNTKKSNGENCKLSVVTVNQESYAVCGSKNTCEIWPILEKASDYFKPNIAYPSGWIAHIYSNWLLRLYSENTQLFAAFVRDMSVENEYIIMGEINECWMEHIVPINDIFIEVYAVLDNGSKDGLPIHCKRTFDLFNKYKMSAKCYKSANVNLVKNINIFTNEMVSKMDIFMKGHCIKSVPYSFHKKSELNAVINGIRSEHSSEGSVLYLLNANESVIGLSKVKASSYVVRRRIRERCRSRLFRPLQSGMIEGFRSSKSKKEAKWTLSEARANAKNHLRKGMGQLSFVPNHRKCKVGWTEFALGFVDWWIDHKLLKGRKDNVKHIDAVLLELDQRFATVLQLFADTKYKNGKSPV